MIIKSNIRLFLNILNNVKFIMMFKLYDLKIQNIFVLFRNKIIYPYVLYNFVLIC